MLGIGFLWKNISLKGILKGLKIGNLKPML